MTSGVRARPAPEADLAAAAGAGDKAAFAALAERYRAELQLHCYRFLGSREDAEDLVQETLLRAWSKRETYAGRSTFRAWLYGIATHACLDALRRRQKRVLPPDVAAAADPAIPPEPPTDLPWLEPYPDRLLDEVAAEAGPESALIARETTELAFLAAIQHLPPRQRAVLILRDVLDWPASQVADLLGTTAAAVNSALQRAHATMASYLPVQDRTGPPGPAVTERERSLVNSLIAAWERADASAVAALLREDARLVMPPTRSWFDGREAITAFFAGYAFRLSSAGRFAAVATAANRQPALAVYMQGPGQGPRQPFALILLRVQDGAIAEMTLFGRPELFAAWGLPATM
jgi:RNA polymerase sigma-70 factor, ECF subfamily